MKNYLIILLLASSTIKALYADSYRREPFLDVLNYSFTISISDTSDMIYGRADITFVVKGAVDTLTFDLKGINENGKGMITDSVSLNITGFKWEHRNNKISIITKNPLETGMRGKLDIVYHGVPADGLIISRNKFGRRTFFSDNWPDRASCYLPCIDHPYDKATVDFYIIAPHHYVIVGNGSLIEESHLDRDRKMTHWKEKIPLATKVMAFGAADFDFALAGTPDSIPVWTYVFTENRDKGFYDYSVAVKPLSFYISLIGPYSYEKLADVQSKTIFGGLENAGCIFYAENSVNGLGRDEGLLAHEIAHQWFGNSVTENDWSNIWLSEGFATYLTAVYMEKTYGEERFEQIMKADRERVIKYWQRTPAPVIDTTITDLMKLLNANSYQKGSWVLHMLRSEIGDDNFWKGIRQFYRKYRNSNASTVDFQSVMEEASGKNLDTFFRQWLYIAGEPDLVISSRQLPGKEGKAEITITQKQEHLFTCPFELLIKCSEGDIHENIRIEERITKLTVSTSRINEIIPDPEVKLLFRRSEK